MATQAAAAKILLAQPNPAFPRRIVPDLSSALIFQTWQLRIQDRIPFGSAAGPPVRPATGVAKPLGKSATFKTANCSRVRDLTDISDGTWHLFNIAEDPGETRDLSAQEPARKTALIAAWEACARDVGVVMPDPPTHPNPPRDHD